MDIAVLLLEEALAMYNILFGNGQGDHEDGT
jgi:hypothetical protein